MKSVVLTALFLLSAWGGLTRIRDRNQAVQQAGVAYAHGDFAGAMLAYRQAVEQLGLKQEAVLLNTAHACLRAGQLGAARTYYGQLLLSRQPRTRSIAQQQLAVLAAQKGQYAQAVGLLHQALLADPANSEARYNYEVLRDYLARHADEPDGPPPPAPAGGPKSEKRPADPQQPGRQPQSKAGTDHEGQLDDPSQPADPLNAPQSHPDPEGQRDPNRPAAASGQGAKGGFQPGKGNSQQVAQGAEPGSVRGLSSAAHGPEAAGTPSRREGTELANLDEDQLQTQRARLQQMNLSTGQARQLLEALNAAEQQYLQQLPHKATARPKSNKPAW